MDALAALADPTRRQIVELLASGDRSAGELAKEFSISRPAVSRHLRVLRDAELVSSEAVAQQRIYSLQPAALDDLDRWVTQTRQTWANHLDALDTEIRRARRTNTDDWKKS